VNGLRRATTSTRARWGSNGAASTQRFPWAAGESSTLRRPLSLTHPSLRPRIRPSNRPAIREWLRGLRVALFLALAALASGCDGGGRQPQLDELERLAFVPQGQFAVATPGGNLVFQVRAPLLFDRFEVRREDWLEREAQLGPWPAELREFAATWDPLERDLPATFVTQREAQRFAESRGMRLPTAGEWIFASAGPQRLPFPWGATRQKGVANTLELEFGRLAPCGAFETGRTPHGVYDLHGNAAEWTADLAPSPERRGEDERVSVLGGSFRSYSRPLLVGEVEPFGKALAPLARADDIGFRCCVEAADYLATHTRAIDLDSEARSRLVAIGRRWGRRALPLLSDLATRPQAAPALRLLAEGAAQ
jgi:hypothetical protein